MTREEADKAVVRRFLEACGTQDFDALADTLAPDVVQYYQRPTGRSDDGAMLAATKTGRDAILSEIRDHFYVTLYKPGSASVSIERMIWQDGWIAAQFSLAARTFADDRPYENFYHFLYCVEDGRIARYWEYVDTAYANDTLFPDAGERRMRDYYRTYNKGDLTALADFYADDVAFTAAGVTIVGRDKVLEMVSGVLAGFEDEMTPRLIAISGTSAMVQIDDVLKARFDIPDFLGRSVKAGETVTLSMTSPRGGSPGRGSIKASADGRER